MVSSCLERISKPFKNSLSIVQYFRWLSMHCFKAPFNFSSKSLNTCLQSKANPKYGQFSCIFLNDWNCVACLFWSAWSRGNYKQLWPEIFYDLGNLFQGRIIPVHQNLTAPFLKLINEVEG